ncbi:primase, DNA, polypeptide 1 (49kDa) [Balamuthia mandrillaris]
MYCAEDLKQGMKFFYENLYPANELYQWWSYGEVQKDTFMKREFSFEIDIPGGGTTYKRYLCYENTEQFKNDLAKEVPRKIDVGAIYSAPPQRKLGMDSKAFVPVEKELVFDIDITDYDDVRSCCSGTDICGSCWPLMAAAIKVMDRVLREDFGFRCILWVYSGRRGVHCWVCDARARQLNQSGRTAVAEYIAVATQNKRSEGVSFVSLPKDLHPSLKQSYDEVLYPTFVNSVIPQQHLLDDEAHWSKILQPLPHILSLHFFHLFFTLQDIAEKISEHWKKHDATPEERWQELVPIIQQAIAKKEIPYGDPIQDIVFTYTYPRLDIQVSIHMNHLLKSPFCVHPGTQRVCVPIDARICDQFDPLAVPTVRQLENELNQYDAQHANDSQQPTKRPLYKKTSLANYVKLLQSFLLEPLYQEIRLQKRTQMEERNTLDF